ncbi:MAG: alpha-L-arabinofuranosidase [Prolixibacteraceae bacterium]|nr:alpha-L-arabinofuranosidase [Prolixibacteraceae bacterium]
MKRNSIFSAILGLFLIGASQAFSQETTITVNAKTPGAAIQPTMYGIFFEDINFGADGGLYAELIKNRSFEFDNHLLGWSAFGNVQILSEKPCFERNPNFARLSFQDELTSTGLDNEGFKGVGLKAKETYKLSFYSRNLGSDTLKVQVNLISWSNDIIASKIMKIQGNEWKKYETELLPSITDAHAKIRILLLNKGAADFDHISMFPAKTYNNRTNGLREDLATALEDLHPGLFRFPGGCIVEGTTLDTRYQWKETIGPVENRPTNINRWNYIFPHKRFPDYYQSYGLGFYEYFLLSEDIGAEPLPVINCGLICQYVSKHEHEHCSVSDLQPYIQDALDLIEFANGPVTSKWGKVRSEMGHPAPFNLKFMAVGNEQWGTPYSSRLEPFLKAIREKYPEIQIVGSSGPYPHGEDFEFGWKEMRRLKADLVDEHFYRDPKWFLNNAARYDKYDRTGPKVFAGEYACHTNGQRNNFEAALCEAAFMTGMERNADVVHMTAYAPLFAHVDTWQWRPDLIWFDNLKVVKTPSYFVQQLYSKNVGTNVLATTLNGQAISGQDSLYASSVIDKNKGEIILKIANVSTRNVSLNYQLDGLKTGEYSSSHTVFHQDKITDENTFENPNLVVPVSESKKISLPKFSVELKPKSFNLIVVQLVNK